MMAFDWKRLHSPQMWFNGEQIEIVSRGLLCKFWVASTNHETSPRRGSITDLYIFAVDTALRKEVIVEWSIQFSSVYNYDYERCQHNDVYTSFC